MDYTERIEGFQIRDLVYLVPPENAPIRYDVVKWFSEKKPHIGTVLHRTPDGRLLATKELITEHCYSVATLEWDEHEPGFVFHSVGLRWLEEKPSEAVIDMILRFCAEKEKEFGLMNDEEAEWDDRQT